MKKLLLFLTLLIVGVSANAQYSPSNNLNYIKLLKTPPIGSVEDSVMVYDSSSSFVKMLPKSSIVAGYELKSNKQNSLAIDGTGTKYATVDAVNSGLTTKATDANVVHNTGAESVGGVKTFTSTPKFSTAAIGINNSDNDGYGNILLNVNRFIFQDKTNAIQFLTQNSGFVTYKSPTISGTFSNASLTANRTFTLPDVSGTIPIVSQTITNGVTDKSPSEDAVFDALDLKVSGSGTTNYLPKFTASGTVGNSLIYDNGTNVGIGTTTDNGNKLRVNGTGYFDGKLTLSADADNEQLLIKRASTPNSQLIIGYHSVGYGRIQAVEQGVGYKPIVLNSDGGNVLIGTTTDNGNKLRVNGTGYFDSSVTATNFNGSATLTGTPTAPTAAAGTNTTQIATMEAVQTGLGESVKLTGDQTISGQKNFSSTGKIGMYTNNAFPAISVTTSGSIGRTAAEFINSSSFPNSSALRVQTHLSGGVGNMGLIVDNYSPIGTGIVSNSSEGGVSISSQSGNGDSYISNITFGGTGRNYVGRNNGTETYSVDKTGSVTATQYKISALNTAPVSATATGTLGEIRITAGFIYVCTATNTWVRTALTTW